MEYLKTNLAADYKAIVTLSSYLMRISRAKTLIEQDK